MILIGIGANLPSETYGSPLETCEAAIAALGRREGIRVVRRSRWFESAPVPMSDQPWYVNGACVVETCLDAAALLRQLHKIESEFGRVRGEKNAPRVLDLDLLAYDDLISDSSNGMDIPHPRLHERAFVLLPLLDLVPGWTHPVIHVSLEALIAQLPPEQIIRPIEPIHGSLEVDDDPDEL